MRHRRGTPGLTPYRLRTIEAGYPRRRRPARHLRRGKPSTPLSQPSTPLSPPGTLSQPGMLSQPSAPLSPPATISQPSTSASGLSTSASGLSTSAPGLSTSACGLSTSACGHSTDSHRRWLARRTEGARRRVAGSQVVMGIAGAVTLALLIVGGYQAAAGAAVFLGMF